MLTPYSRARIKKLILAGHLSLNDQPITNPSHKIRQGDVCRLSLPPVSEAKAQPQSITLDILHEDQDLLVVNKPSGMVVHPGAGNPDQTLVNALLHHCAGELSGIGGVLRPGIVHRIDKDTSGLLLVAKNDASHQHLAQQLADRNLKRSYYALIHGIPEKTKGCIDAPLGRSSANRKKIAIRPDGKRAVTHWMVERVWPPNIAMIRCRLQTGRTHQIRVHLASISHPLVGDPLYGGRARGSPALRSILKDQHFHRQALHAHSLGFVHPRSGQTLSFTAPLPDDLQCLITALNDS